MSFCLRLSFIAMTMGIAGAGSAMAQSSPSEISREIPSAATAFYLTAPLPAPRAAEAAARPSEPQPTAAEAVTEVATKAEPERSQSSVTAATTSGPRLDQARAGVPAPLPAAATAPALMPPRAGKPVALMVVGAAAVVTGLIIGDDEGAFIAIGGLAVGLYGLYNYVK